MTDERVKEIAELEVRRYFDDYLQRVLPEQMRAGRAHTHTMIEQHDADREAHDGVERKVNRAIWMAMGFGAVIGVPAGMGLKALAALL